MNIELKSIKYFAAGSEETSCFTADIWIDGKKAGDARNDGHGGSNMYSPWSLAEKLNAHAKTLPPIISSIKEADGSLFTYQPDADTVIGDLFDAHLVVKDLTRLLKGKLLYTVADKDGVFATKLTPAQMASVRAKGASVLPAKWMVKQVLNLLPFDQALKIYREVK